VGKENKKEKEMKTQQISSGVITIDGPINLLGSYGLLLAVPHERDVKSAAIQVCMGILREHPEGICISLPCGNGVLIKPSSKFIYPFDIPCPCGDKSHWLVKYFIDPRRDPNIRN
jgi:hypothetical protein